MGGDLDVGRFAQSFEQFLERFREALPARSTTVRRRATDHLGVDPAHLPTYTERLDPSEHANLQLALEALLADAPGWSLLGLPAELHHYGDFSLQAC